jgi:hypothetical protein
MSSIPPPTSIPEALDMLDDAMSYFDGPDFMAFCAVRTERSRCCKRR